MPPPASRSSSCLSGAGGGTGWRRCASALARAGRRRRHDPRAPVPDRRFAVAFGLFAGAEDGAAGAPGARKLAGRRRLSDAERGGAADAVLSPDVHRSEEHTSELQSLMRISYAVFCLKKKKKT